MTFPSQLLSHQQGFLLNVASLIQFADSLDFFVTAGELWRPPEMQAYYYKIGKSKIKVGGNHGRRLAIDLNIFTRQGRFATVEEIRPLGTYWKSLHPLNRWGGDWKNPVDGPHFERNAP